LSGGDGGGGDDEVAFVFAEGAVKDDNELAALCRISVSKMQIMTSHLMRTESFNGVGY